MVSTSCVIGFGVFASTELRCGAIWWFFAAKDSATKNAKLQCAEVASAKDTELQHAEVVSTQGIELQFAEDSEPRLELEVEHGAKAKLGYAEIQYAQLIYAQDYCTENHAAKNCRAQGQRAQSFGQQFPEFFGNTKR